MSALLTMAIDSEEAVVAARQRARHVAELLGFDAQDQTRIATAVSEIVRNALRYAGGGTAEFSVSGSRPMLVVRVVDSGGGIDDLDAVLAGRYVSRTGLGIGLAGARRLVDAFDIETEPGRGTRVMLGKRLPPGAPSPDRARLRVVADQLVVQRPHGMATELEIQNRELLAALSEMRGRQEDLIRLKQELEDTNRGVLALYAELEERADQLRRVNQLKAQFLSYMSHEFRTPLDSILALSGLLLARADGELTDEQEKQVGYVQRSARDLLNLVDDLLDTARVDAGQIAIRPSTFTAGSLFNTLRALLRPLVRGEQVSLGFGDTRGLPSFYSDEGKVAQILRNFISNALKFTEQGEVVVSAELEPDGEHIRFVVTDTGIGIDPADQDRIFQDFAQVDGAVQRRVRGTGLGLPLSKKLAELLGGSVSVESEPGAGSRFHLVLPLVAPGVAPDAVGAAPADGAGNRGLPYDA